MALRFYDCAQTSVVILLYISYTSITLGKLERVLRPKAYSFVMKSMYTTLGPCSPFCMKKKIRQLISLYSPDTSPDSLADAASC